VYKNGVIFLAQPVYAYAKASVPLAVAKR